MDEVDTIAAIATPHGSGGVGVVRVSGPRAKEISQKLTGKKLNPRQATLTKYKDLQQKDIDIGLSILFLSPNSFTGEDVVELQGHGGQVVLTTLLEAVLALGARMANPGEFSARAFQNNKIDLAQAEAIADLISAQSKQAAGASLRSLQGGFSKEINGLVKKLISLRVKVEAAIDFPEDVGADHKSILKKEIRAKLALTDKILSSAEHGRLLTDGIKVVVLGEPNVGKSSILNLLTEQEHAIVTDVPGTTRDVLRAQISLKGVRLDILDTAGIRGTDDKVEQEGIKRSWQAVNTAQIVLLVVDGMVDNPLKKHANWILKFPHDAKILIIQNKIDKSSQKEGFFCQDGHKFVRMSAKTGAGKKELEEALSGLLGVNINQEPAFIARKRHIVALEGALGSLKGAEKLLDREDMFELAAEELRLAQQELDSITGKFTADDLLGKIFADFCLGK